MATIDNEASRRLVLAIFTLWKNIVCAPEIQQGLEHMSIAEISLLELLLLILNLTCDNAFFRCTFFVCKQ